MKNFIINILYFLVVADIAMIFLSIFTGCASLPVSPKQPITPGTSIIWKTISSTDWLMSIFLIAIVGGVFAGINGFKAGWAGAFSAFVGILLKAALSVTWVYIAAGLILVGCVLLFVVSVLIKKNALTEIIKGVQIAKDEISKIGDGDPVTKKLVEDIKAKLVEELSKQTKSTQKLVQQVKGNLKVKGEI